jgi:hypothetical protein
MTLSEQQRTKTAEALEEVTRFAVRQMAALPAIGFTAMATLARSSPRASASRR